MKQKYIPPEIEDFDLEMESQILQSSVPVDENFEEVDTMGQEVEDINPSDWSHTW